jgi:putative DNA-invertase from lambdoid prophage Rac
MEQRFGYFRVSSGDQSVEAQRHAMGGGYDQEFVDEGVSGAVMAEDRPAFAQLLSKVRKGDSVYVYAVDRLGRDALDVQSTVRKLLRAGVTIHIHGLERFPTTLHRIPPRQSSWRTPAESRGR